MKPIDRIDVSVLSGCDYNHSIRGIGIKRAIKYKIKSGNLFETVAHLRNKKNYK